ncbi:Ig-like domain-containing protein [Microbulbifer sp. SAOS-129_SWC]|uniref:Ig-like domain-containing protein n=1 Tax=Microbulbifer sp. SAOS-129_SWC TaxID=3145235 RepID=UPI00321762E8
MLINRLILLALLGSILSSALTGCDNSSSRRRANQPPQIMDLSFTTEADTPYNGQLEASDPEGDPVTFLLVTAPTLGTVTVAEEDGSFRYQPNPGITGKDSFQVKVDNGNFSQPGSDTATVSVEIVAQTVSFQSYSRAAFAQSADDEPLPVNGRKFTQDADANSYSDLLQ